MSMSHAIAPSILAADFTKLANDISMVNMSEADYLHVDVMDGVFVPAISFGQDIVRQMKKVCEKPLDVHLMIIDPDRYIKSFVEAGAEIITVHYEACTHLHRTIQLIHSYGVKAGVAINPHTPASVLDDVLEDLDLALVMSVNPGFGGQKFIYRALHKIEYIAEQIRQRNLACKIEVDGGVGEQNMQSVLKAGADVLVAGSAVFRSENPLETIKRMKAVDLHTFTA